MAMMLDNANCDGGILLSLDSHKAVPAPFLTKTYQLVDDHTTDHIVSWGEDDATFVVWRPPEFARDLLPNYFKHNNFSSFVRQLNTYGFRKIVPDRWEFANEFFKKGEKHLLCEIHRRKTSQPQVPLNHHHHHFTAIGGGGGGGGSGFFTYPTTRSISPPDSDDHLYSDNSPPLSSPTTTATTAATTMEVEVKLRLPDAAAHQHLSNILSPHHTKTHLQQNLFFDTPHLTLATAHSAALRLRFYDLDSRSILSLKSKPQISGGISRIHEAEESLDPAVARRCAADPRQFTAVEDSMILNKVVGEFGVDLNQLVCLGGFRNVRSVYDWKGLKLELDETMFDFGVCYEIECESDEPDEAKLVIEELLNRNGIRFCYSQVSKFAVFRSGKMPEFM